MTEGNRGMMHKKQLGHRLRIEASLEMQLHNNRPPRLSHHCWPSQSVKRPEGGIAGGFLIVCSVDPAGFLVARSGVHGIRQGQCCRRRLRVAQLHAS